MTDVATYSDVVLQFPEVPAASMDRGLPQVPDMLLTQGKALSGKRVAILTAKCPEEVEILFPLYHLRLAGAQVDVITPNWIQGQVETTLFTKPSRFVTVDKNISEARAEDYDAVLIPGGAWNPIILRTDADVLEFIRAMHVAGKLVASICHGPQVLISAGLISGRRVTGVSDIRIDLANAGGFVVEDQAVVLDGNLLTSRDPNDIGPFTSQILAHLNR